MKIVLTGGGTAGHVIPNLALLPLLKRDFEGIVYIGSENGIEKTLVARENLPFYSVPCEKFRRSLSLKNLTLPFRVLKGISAAKVLLQKLSPDVVFSKGGYVALPVVVAAKRLKIPVVSHESDLSMGLSNRLTKVCSMTLCTTFEKTAEKLKNGVFTGSPIRESLFSGNKSKALLRANFAKVQPVVLVFGGSLGAKAVNETVFKCVAKLPEFNILHITGKNNTIKILADNYAQFEYVFDIENFFAAADIVVSRAGSNAVCELLSLSKPMLLVPLPKGNSRGDQMENAKYFQSLGYANVLPQTKLSPVTLAAEIRKLYEKRKIFTDKMKAAKNTDGTVNIYNQILKAAKK